MIVIANVSHKDILICLIKTHWAKSKMLVEEQVSWQQTWSVCIVATFASDRHQTASLCCGPQYQGTGHAQTGT